MKEYTDWKKQFKQEFGIHFVGSSGELKFAITFINDLLKEEKLKLINQIEKDFNKWFNQGIEPVEDFIERYFNLTKT